MSSGETDPGLTSLYPEDDTPEEHHQILVRHARQLELGVITAREHYKSIKNLNETLGKTNALLQQQIEARDLEKADQKLVDARRDFSLKRMTALLGFGGAIVGALGAAAAAYLARDSKIPETKPPTAEQVKAYEEHQRAAKHEPVPTPEFNALVDSQK
jgi:hypothetical protein